MCLSSLCDDYVKIFHLFPFVYERFSFNNILDRKRKRDFLCLPIHLRIVYLEIFHIFMMYSGPASLIIGVK